MLENIILTFHYLMFYIMEDGETFCTPCQEKIFMFLQFEADVANLRGWNKRAADLETNGESMHFARFMDGVEERAEKESKHLNVSKLVLDHGSQIQRTWDSMQWIGTLLICGGSIGMGLRC